VRLKNNIAFNEPLVIGKENNLIDDVISSGNFSGDGKYTKKCNLWLEEYTKSAKCLLTTSCTHALEMAAILINIKPGDEVILPSFTFVSSANPFVLRGAKIVFVDIRPDTMNIDERKICAAITERTKAIVVVHYAGVACEMNQIMKIANDFKLMVIEDAAQALLSKYNDRPLGTFGDIGCFSFHETKNIQCGEGGAIVINNKSFVKRAEVIREKGTNRSDFFRGIVDKYRWIDIGSSYLPNEITAAFLYGQLKNADKITLRRLELWNLYSKLLSDISEIEIMTVPEKIKHNGHIFFIKTKNLRDRSKLILFLEKHGVSATFHYIPLHESRKCSKFCLFHGDDISTTIESERILRLPMHYNLSIENIKFIVSKIKEFYAH